MSTYKIIGFVCLMVLGTARSSEQVTPLTSKQKKVMRDFVTTKLKESGKVYDFLFNPSSTVQEEGLTGAQKVIANFLSTVEDPKLRKLVFFLVCELPDLDKVFRSYDTTDIIGGFFTTTNKASFDEKKPLDATFRRAVTSIESILNIIKTLDDSGRNNLAQLLDYLQPFASNLVHVQKQDFYKRVDLFQSDQDESKKVEFEKQLSNPDITTKQKLAYLRVSVDLTGIAKKTGKSVEEIAEQVLSDWQAFVKTETSFAHTAVFLKNKTVVDQAIKKFGEKLTPKTVEFLKAELKLEEDEIRKLWPSFTRTQELFGKIKTAKRCLKIQHGATNIARGLQGKDSLDFDKDVIANATEFDTIINDSWISQAQKIGASKAGEVIFDSFSKGVTGITTLVSSIRSGNFNVRVQEVAHDISTLVKKPSEESGNVAVIDLIETYALPQFQKIHKALATTQADTLKGQKSILRGNILKAIKGVMAQVVNAFKDATDTLVINGLEQDPAQYYQPLLEGYQSTSNMSTEQALQAVADYIENKELDGKKLLKALASLSYHQVVEKNSYTDQKISENVCILLKISQIIQFTYKDKADEFINGLTGDEILAVTTTVQQAIEKKLKESGQNTFGSRRLSSTETERENYVAQLNDSSITQLIIKKLDLKVSAEQQEELNTLSLQNHNLSLVPAGPVPTEDPQTEQQQEEELQQKFGKFSTEEFNQLYLDHFNETPAITSTELTGNPLVDMLRTFPPKLRSLTFSLISLGSAQEIYDFKNNKWQTFKSTLNALFGGSKAPDRDPVVNYLKSALDAGFSLLNIIDTLKPEHRESLVSWFEMLKPMMELGLSNRLSVLYETLSGTAGVTLKVPLKDFNNISTIGKMEIVKEYFAANPIKKVSGLKKYFKFLNNNSQDSRLKVATSFTDLSDITAKIDGVLFYIKNKKTVEDSFKKTDPIAYLNTQIPGNDVKGIWKEIKQIRKYFNWSSRIRSVVDGIQKICNYFRSKENQVKYTATHYANADELLEDIKKSPIKNIQKFLTETKTGQFITAETTSIGRKIIWAFTVEGSGEIAARVHDIVEDIKAQNLDRIKIQPLIDFVQKFASKDQITSVVQRAGSALEQAKQIPTIAEGARFLLEALESLKSSFTLKESASDVGDDIVALAQGLEVPLSESLRDLFLPPNEDTQDDPAVASSNLIETVAALSNDVIPSQELIDTPALMTQKQYNDQVFKLGALRVTALMTEHTFTDAQLRDIVPVIIDHLSEKNREKARLLRKSSFEVQLIDAAQRLGDDANGEVIKTLVNNQLKALQPPAPVVLSDADRVQQITKELQILEGKKKLPKVEEVQPLLHALENIEDPKSATSLINRLFKLITPLSQSSNLSKEIPRSTALYDALQKSLEPFTVTDPVVPQWIKKELANGKMYLNHLKAYNKTESVQIRLHLINDLIQRCKNYQELKGIITDDQLAQERLYLLQSVAPLIKEKFFSLSSKLSSDNLATIAKNLMDLVVDKEPQVQQAFIEGMKSTIKSDAFRKVLEDQQSLQQTTSFDFLDGLSISADPVNPPVDPVIAIDKNSPVVISRIKGNDSTATLHEQPAATSKGRINPIGTNMPKPTQQPHRDLSNEHHERDANERNPIERKPTGARETRV